MRLKTSSQVVRLYRKSQPAPVSSLTQPPRPDWSGERTYRVQVAGKLFQGHDLRTLLRLAVAAKRDPARC